MIMTSDSDPETAAPPRGHESPDRGTRLTLAFLWAWVLFNYVYGDILHIFTIFMSPALQAQLERGAVGGIPLDDSTLLAMAVGMELSIMMVFLAWKLPQRVNRWLNILVGTLFTLIMAAILFASGGVPPLTGYTLYAAIEIAITASIVRIAWSWPAAEVGLSH